MKLMMNRMSSMDSYDNNVGNVPSPLDHVEIVLATKDNTKGVGWMITDGDDAIDKGCNIPFYKTVKEGDNYDHADWKDQAVVRQAKISWRDDFSITWMERHMEMTQGFLLVGNAPALLILGEPTHGREDLTEEEKCLPDFSRTKGYIVPPGCGIIIKKGTWHDFPVSVGPEVTVFVINTKEVVDSLKSMKEPAPMDFGDCFKVRLSDYPDTPTMYFPDPRPLVDSLGLTPRPPRRSSKLELQLAEMAYLDDTAGHDFSRHESSISTASTESNISNGEKESTSPGEPATFEYGREMTREEVGQWGGSDANKVWVVPVINVESFDPDSFGPSVQPHLNKTQPELANRGWRDYGNKRGLKRLGKLFSKHDIPCTAVVSSDLVGNNEVMSLLNTFKKDNRWEIGAHGANNSNAGHMGLSEPDEVLKISSSLDQLGSGFQGDGPKTWLTPGFSVTNSTPKLLSEAGVETLLDFVDDDVPFNLRTNESSGSPSKSLLCVPYSMETNDFSLVLTRNLSPREYAAALESHISQLAEESSETGTPSVVCLGMHTFVAGTPASVHELNKVLSRLQSNSNIKWATAQEVTECVKRGEADEVHQEPSPCELSSSPAPTTPANTSKLCIEMSPAGTVSLDRDRVGLILIDFQNDFLCKDGFGEKLGNDPSKLRRAVEPTKQVLSSVRKAGLTVVHTREGHRANLTDLTSLKAGDGTIIGCETQTGRTMVRGEWGHDIIADLKPLSDGSETVIDKPGKGAFYQTDLELVLKTSNIDTLIVCGVTTEICVHSTVREANDRGIRCIMLKDCTASYFDEFHECGLKMIAAQGGILGQVTDSRSVLNGLERMN